MESGTEGKAYDQRIAQQVAGNAAQELQRALARLAAYPAFGALHQHGARDHHHRQVHRQQDRQRDDPLLADDARDQRQADEDGVGEGRGNTGQHAHARIAAKGERRRQMADGPGDGDA